MPISQSEWDAEMTDAFRDKALEDQYGEEAPAVCQVFLERPGMALSARDVLNLAFELPPLYVGHIRKDEDGTKTRTDINRTDQYAKADDHISTLLDNLAEDGVLEQRLIHTDRGREPYYKFNPGGLRTALCDDAE